MFYTLLLPNVFNVMNIGGIYTYPLTKTTTIDHLKISNQI